LCVVCIKIDRTKKRWWCRYYIHDMVPWYGDCQKQLTRSVVPVIVAAWLASSLATVTECASLLVLAAFSYSRFTSASYSKHSQFTQLWITLFCLTLLTRRFPHHIFYKRLNHIMCFMINDSIAANPCQAKFKSRILILLVVSNSM